MNPVELTLEERRRRYRKEEQDALHKKGDVKQLKRLLVYLKPRRYQVAFAILISITLACLIPAPMIIIKLAIDNYIVPGDFNGLLWMAGGLLAIQIIIVILEAYSTILITKIGQYTMRDMRMEIFNHLQSQPLRFFDKNPVGRLITRITSDVNVLNDLFAQGIVGVFQQVFSLFVILLVLLYYNWQLTLWLLPVFPLIAIASWNFRHHVYQSYRLFRVRLSRLNSFMQENITGMKTVQANSREKSQFDHFDELNDGNRKSLIDLVFQYALFFPVVEIISTLGLAIVLWKGGTQFIANNPTVATVVTIGELALFIQALERFFMPIKDLSEKYNIIQSAIASAERLFVLLDTKPDINDPENPVEIGPLTHSIEFKNVWFAYIDEEWVLKDVSFSINKGETVAIVGPTGSGKTTLMSLLCRFYDIQKGDILIDGISIRNIRQKDLRKKLAIVLQDVFLFKGSVIDNIRLGNKEEISREQVINVSQETGSDKFVRKLPDGYDNGVKERGATLSTGQKQLIAFSRALAFDPEILILDEATANIDTESEIQLQKAVQTLCKNRTSIVIAHRLSTIKNSHKIIVLHHGHLIEQGAHNDLLNQDGLYRKLYELQYKND
jgi:ATP-binding cassette, subfamily B, multidrug efflux pump